VETAKLLSPSVVEKISTCVLHYLWDRVSIGPVPDVEKRPFSVFEFQFLSGQNQPES